jgi:hypothetical protein
MREPLDARDWRVFRLLMSELPDPEWEIVEQQLQREVVQRQECDHSLVRLFFSSLSALDLQRAGAEIRYERGERLEILRKLKLQSQSAMPSQRKKPRRNAKPQRLIS